MTLQLQQFNRFLALFHHGQGLLRLRLTDMARSLEARVEVTGESCFGATFE